MAWYVSYRGLWWSLRRSYGSLGGGLRAAALFWEPLRMADWRVHRLMNASNVTTTDADGLTT